MHGSYKGKYLYSTRGAEGTGVSDGEDLPRKKKRREDLTRTNTWKIRGQSSKSDERECVMHSGAGPVSAEKPLKKKKGFLQMPRWVRESGPDLIKNRGSSGKAWPKNRPEPENAWGKKKN